MTAFIHYDPTLKKRAAELRKRMTPGELSLWSTLRDKRWGYHFHRQKPIGHYIVDFYCPDLRLAIEIDGSSHFLKEGRDVQKQLYLSGLSIEVVRFSEKEAVQNISRVIGSLEAIIRARSHCKTPSVAGRRDTFLKEGVT